MTEGKNCLRARGGARRAPARRIAKLAARVVMAMAFFAMAGAHRALAGHDGKHFLVLQTNLQPPYQQLSNGALTGSTIRLLDCAFQQIDIDYGITLAPRQRNRDMTRKGQADGFFLSRLSSEMDSYADATVPLVLEKWVWVSARRDVDVQVPVPLPDQMVTVGAVLGSNEAEWITEQGYRDFVHVPSLRSLLGLIGKGRIDFALIDRQSFERARDDLKLDPDSFSERFARYMPLVMYFAHEYTRAHPATLTRLNRALAECGSAAVKLEAQEIDRIMNDDVVRIRRLLRAPALVNALKEHLENLDMLHGEGMSRIKIAELDRQWREASKSGAASLLAADILQNDVSTYLQRAYRTRDVQFAEAFIFDRDGLIIGMSSPTSNYDQSHERKFAIFNETAADAVQIADIYYDPSTQKFLSQITLPITDPVTGKVLAALTVGLDVLLALQVED
ncbi:transporter substrate-binding domain-containing protein [Thalassospira mesophila]|uniref:transporter substrate-binding domain-containing protein n=1 Tax=Thalassospira mesophila TaxID=1293891 RepID=UPI00117E4D5D|nr:PDC sensor domain-containing protein [Thalassospira mesophila]